ncbi:MAG: hypothetical protein ACXWID_01530 [Pyrinomonadaceae bacterium]
MKKKEISKSSNGDADEMRQEYRIDYGKSRSNRFAQAMKEQPLVVMVDADVARVFPTAESVNEALRALIAAMPKSGGKRLNK